MRAKAQRETTGEGMETSQKTHQKTQYIFVKSEKQTFNIHRFQRNLFRRLFQNPFVYVYNMIVYHALILFAAFGLGINVPAKVAVQLGIGAVDAIAYENQALSDLFTWTSFIFLSMILFFDFALLKILKDEIKPKPGECDKNGMPVKEILTYPRIMAIEVLIFIIGILNPYIRTGMFFFSGNTLQVVIAKKWIMKKWSPAKYFFIIGSYGLIAQLLIYLIKQIWPLLWI